MAVLDIEQAIKAFAYNDIETASLTLWTTLGYQSNKQLELPKTSDRFFESLNVAGTLNRNRAEVAEWESAHFLFQLTNDEIPSLAYGQMSLIAGDLSYQKGMIESFVFLAIELSNRGWTRTQLASITRELNRAFPMPAIVLFQYNKTNKINEVERLLSISIIDRRVNKRDANKDVIDQSRIAIIKDIAVETPHRAHLEILNDIALENIGAQHAPSTFRDLYESWMRVLSVKKLNQRFYDELFTWYCWALKNTTFPQGQTPDKKKKASDPNLYSVAVIRLLTRLIFVWFVKEKGVVSADLFRLSILNNLLKEPPTEYPESSSYYQAVLQNLFFATLNTEPTERRWKSNALTSGDKPGLTDHYLVHTVYRYRQHFKDASSANKAFSLFKSIPFLNGGLFECLDREVSERDLQRTPYLRASVQHEGKHQVLRIDGFSDRPDNRLSIPNKLFFSSQGETVDLSEELHTKRGQRTARGLIDIFERYKFTIEENTPIEEEVALDPELLGNVFENLLASYNTDTELTARKQSGAFYTPREVVDYMVDEALFAYLEPQVANRVEETQEVGRIGDARVRSLLAFGSQGHDFSSTEVSRLISAIENLKTLDPACGSGAFPMGMLQKLVHVLTKLDPANSFWKAQNRAPLERQLKDAESIPDPTLRETKVEDAQDALEKLDRSFSDKHYADYSRKLFLIEKCLFGVDREPIAVQIAKLRFFISLVVSQKMDTDPNAVVNNYNITPLPNLETKVVTANSLVPIDRPIQGSLRDTRIDEKEDELRLANERHFAARTTKTKRKWRDRINDLREELAELLEQDAQLTKLSAKQVVAWNSFDQNISATFFEPEWMFGVRSGFDIIIGNPPYIRIQTLKQQDPQFVEFLNRHYESTQKGSYDLYVVFVEAGLKLLKRNGHLAYILPHKFFNTQYGEPLRRIIARGRYLRKVVHFGEQQVFSGATNFVCLLFLEKIGVNECQWVRVKNFPEWLLNQTEDEQIVSAESLSEAEWTFGGIVSDELLAQIRRKGCRLLNIPAQMSRGSSSGDDSIFIIDAKQDLVENEILRIPVSARDFKRYRFLPNEHQRIIFPYKEVDGKFELMPENELRRDFPRTFEYLYSHKARLTGRKGARTWYSYSAPRNLELHNTAQILVPLLAAEPSFTFIPSESSGALCPMASGGFTITIPANAPVHPEYILALLNSQVVFWVLVRTSNVFRGGWVTCTKQYFGELPIHIINMDTVRGQIQHNTIVSLVRCLLWSNRPSLKHSADHKLLSNSTLNSFEQLLQGLIYELYFPEDLHSIGIDLFVAAQEAGVADLIKLTAGAQVSEAERIANIIFKNDHRIFRMLFDLQAVPVVRIIEGKE